MERQTEEWRAKDTGRKKDIETDKQKGRNKERQSGRADEIDRALACILHVFLLSTTGGQ